MVHKDKVCGEELIVYLQYIKVAKFKVDWKLLFDPILLWKGMLSLSLSLSLSGACKDECSFTGASLQEPVMPFTMRKGARE
jgi:hypothetical protein